MINRYSVTFGGLHQVTRLVLGEQTFLQYLLPAIAFEERIEVYLLRFLPCISYETLPSDTYQQEVRNSNFLENTQLLMLFVRLQSPLNTGDTVTQT